MKRKPLTAYIAEHVARREPFMGTHRGLVTEVTHATLEAELARAFRAGVRRAQLRARPAELARDKRILGLIRDACRLSADLDSERTGAKELRRQIVALYYWCKANGVHPPLPAQL